LKAMNEPTWLAGFRHNACSQTGEDGVIERALQVLPHRDQWCVEFGAWDGRHLSNVRNLIDNRGYSAILIEGSRSRFADLQRHCAGNANVIPINRFVGFTAHDSLDAILRSTPIPQDFDFLSIDIDGNDYHVWKAISHYRPRLVCIEFNPTIPTEVHFVQPADPTVNQGASLLALVELGKAKGYELVCVLPFNAFFVRSEDFPLFGIEDNSPHALRTDLSYVTFLFSGFDGRLFLCGNRTLPWHGLKLNAAPMQRLPRILQRYPGNYTGSQRLLRRLHRLWSRMRMFFASTDDGSLARVAEPSSVFGEPPLAVIPRDKAA
jgi:hypothetical protein